RSRHRGLARLAAARRVVRQHPRTAGIRADVLSRLFIERAFSAPAGENAGLSDLFVSARQYFALIGNSSAGNREIRRQPLSVTTTSSSMRAAEKPSVAGQ